MAEQGAREAALAEMPDAVNLDHSLRDLSIKETPPDLTNTNDNAIVDVEDPQNRLSNSLKEPGNFQSDPVTTPSTKFTQHGESYGEDPSRTETTSDLSTGYEDVFVRYAGETLGTIPAKEAFHKYMDKYFPNLDTSVYMTPPIPVGHPPVMREKTDIGYIYGPEYYYLLGDESEKRVAECMEYFFKHLAREKDPVFIITSYHFDGLHDNKYDKKGEHDVLIIHYRYGLIFIETKGCMGKSDDAVNSVIQACLSQQEKNRRFFGINFPDVKDVSTTCVLAFPNILKNTFHTFNKSVKRIKESGFSTDECLFLDNIPSVEQNSETKQNLVEWWSRMTEKQRKGFQSLEEYRSVIERYVGEHSTVKIPVSSAKHDKEGPGRSYGECVAGLGNRYMNIVLTPTQVAVYNTFIDRLILRGDYGSGKTILLILQAIKLLKQGKKVWVINMAESPLHHVLEASILHGLEEDTDVRKLLISIHVTDQRSLRTVLEMCTRIKANVLIDECRCLSLARSADPDIQPTLSSFPPECVLWIAIAQEKDVDPSKHLCHLIFDDKISQPQNGKFKQILLEEILRCPPSILPFWPNFREPQKPFSGTIQIPKVVDHLASVGLMPSFDTKLVVRDMTDPKTERRPLFRQLEKLDIPLCTSPDASDKAVYTFGSRVFSSIPVAEFVYGGNTNIQVYVKDRDTPPETPESPKTYNPKTFAKFLYKLGFGNDDDTIAKRANQGQMDKRKKLRQWKDLVFNEATFAHFFLSRAGLPFRSSRVSEGPNLNIEINSDSIVFLAATSGGFEGYQKRAEIHITDKEKANYSFKEVRPLDGPECFIVHHKHADSLCLLRDCRICKGELEHILNRLGVIEKAAQERSDVSVHEIELSKTRNVLAQNEKPRSDLDWSDVILLDDRTKPTFEKDFLVSCQVPVVDKTTLQLNKKDAFGDPREVLYIRPTQFQGLERKVVIVIQKCEEPCSVLAISRCVSQLIFIKL
ncbi:uncharacterized protein [Haliotis cracherodii]|uniref:uncharacterized protein n=1 Tax=Haliotis cracherodii TaxID=6455 RepID=UPI0039EBED6B